MKLWLRGCVTSGAKLDLQVALGCTWELQTLVVGGQGAPVGCIRRTHGVLDTIINSASTGTWEGLCEWYQHPHISTQGWLLASVQPSAEMGEEDFLLLLFAMSLLSCLITETE